MKNSVVTSIAAMVNFDRPNPASHASVKALLSKFKSGQSHGSQTHSAKRAEQVRFVEANQDVLNFDMIESMLCVKHGIYLKPHNNAASRLDRILPCMVEQIHEELEAA